MRRLLLVALLPLLLGADCERERLAKLDHGQLEVPDDGRDLYPVGGPWVAYVDPFLFDHLGAVEEAVGYVNARLGSHWLDVMIGEELYASAEAGEYGYDMIVLVSAGALRERNWPEPDPGGFADIDWYCREGEDVCVITFCRIGLDDDIAHDWQATRDNLLHELGHCPFGFAHDERSLDLGSCMSSPPAFDCEYTDGDTQRLRGAS